MNRIVIIGFVFILLGSCKSKSSINRTVEEEVHVDQYGAKGNGKYDNSAILQHLINQPTVKKIVFGKGDYFIKKQLIINKSVELVGGGPDKTKIIGDQQILEVEAIPFQTNKYNEKLAQGASSLKLRDNKKLNKGDLIQISSEEQMPELWDSESKKFFTAKIHSIEEFNIYFDRSLPITFNGDEYPIQITFYNPSAFTLKKLQIVSDNTLYIATIRNQSKVNIEDVNFSTHSKNNQGEFLENPQRGVSALGIYGSTDIEARNCSFDYVWYGLMAHEGCNNVVLLDSKAYKARHINNSAICTTEFSVINCTTKFCFGGFDSHPGALTSNFVNCKDLEPVFVPKFRGRRDNIKDCYFEGGIDLITDPGIFEIDDKFGKCKKVESSRIKGLTTISAENITIKNCEFRGAVLNKDVVGFVDIQDCEVIDEGMTNKNDALVTIGNQAPEHFSYTFSLKNIKIVGSYSNDLNETQKVKSWCSIGIYIPMGEGARGSLEDIEVKNFEKGLVLYGGVVSKERYRKVQFKNISITDCHFGIYQHDFFDKPIQLSDIKFKGCTIDDNAPHRLEYPESTKFSSPKKNKN